MRREEKWGIITWEGKRNETFGHGKRRGFGAENLQLFKVLSALEWMTVTGFSCPLQCLCQGWASLLIRQEHMSGPPCAPVLLNHLSASEPLWLKNNCTSFLFNALQVLLSHLSCSRLSWTQTNHSCLPGYWQSVNSRCVSWPSLSDSLTVTPSRAAPMLMMIIVRTSVSLWK